MISPLCAQNPLPAVFTPIFIQNPAPLNLRGLKSGLCAALNPQKGETPA